MKASLTNFKWLIIPAILILAATFSWYLFSSFLLEEGLPNNVSFQLLDVQDSIEWSPDSTKIAGTVLGEGPYPKEHIFIWDSVSSEYTIVSNEKVAENATGLYISTSPKWHPSGESILYSSSHDFGNQSFGVVTLDERTYSGIGNGLSPNWYMDGTQIIYITDSKKSLQVLDFTTKEEETLFSFSGASQIESISVSPDDNWISMISRVQTATGLWKTKLTAIDITSGETSSVFEGQFSALINSWSSDSNWIIIKESEGLVAINIQNRCQTGLLNIEKVFSFALLPGVTWASTTSTIALSGNLGRERGILITDVTTQIIQDWLASGTCVNTFPQ